MSFTRFPPPPHKSTNEFRVIKMGLVHGAGRTPPVIGVGLIYDFSSSFRTKAYEADPTKTLTFEA